MLFTKTGSGCMSIDYKKLDEFYKQLSEIVSKEFTTFDGNEYLLWVRQWREYYKQMTEEIRFAKNIQKPDFCIANQINREKTNSSSVQSMIHFLRKRAKLLMQARMDNKQAYKQFRAKILQERSVAA